MQANKPLKKASAKPALDDYADLDASMDKENISEAAVKNKKKTVEETYQKLTQLEHVLLRPDTYIGSTEFQRTKVFYLRYLLLAALVPLYVA